MSYQKIDYIAYALASLSEAPGLPLAADDIAARCQLMMNAIRSASAAPALDTSDGAGTVLKVFMAPAGFFGGAATPYTLADVQNAINALQKMVADDAWADWVFVFGSIAYQPDPSAPRSYQFCLVQQGGSANRCQLLAGTVLAQFASGVNLVNLSAASGGVLIGQAGGGGQDAPGASVLCDGAGVFTLAGLTWGLDLRDRLTGASILRAPIAPAASAIQVQLVLLSGPSVLPQNVAAGFQGYVFACDGGAASAAAFSVGAAGATPPLALAGTYAMADTPIDLGGSPPREVPVTQLFAAGPGSVNVFAGAPFPPAATVGGQVVALSWPALVSPLAASPAAPTYTFNFSVVYDAQGAYRNTLCQIVCNNLDFMGLNYVMPLIFTSTDAGGQAVAIDFDNGLGSMGYQKSLQGQIQVPGFAFDGAAFLFSTDITGPAPATIW
ncbi:hypothetical protein F2P45_12910 [Massilia sp. CCM 8733]|uniref:Uncharacterized protein n=1 Tax=Massilia mucilaginosa TaxID=2609282 RepID=A0ABX0NTK5_9BURK|nr:hypothetical protein [Massilia mucilaginosa]NHZ89907.1 hypothetical protein [Massilia mucilaginosa]